MKAYHEHPVTILKYSVKNIWLLIFPLLRGINVFRINKDFFYAWLKGAWFDIIILLAIVIFGLLRWRFSVIEVSDASITHMDGIIIRVKQTIPYCNISSTSFEYPFYLRPIGAVRVRCDTSAGLFQSSDMEFMLKKPVCNELSDKIPKLGSNGDIYHFTKPSAVSVIFFSMFFSSGLTGMIYLATFFYKGGSIARDMISKYFEQITSSTEEFSKKLILRVPDAILGIGVFFMVTWFISFVINLLRYSDFSICTDKRQIKVSYGVFTRKNYLLTKTHINYLDMRQNLVMKIFRLTTVHISCAGYGNTRKRLPVLIPVRKEKKVAEELENLGASVQYEHEYKPKLRGIWQYTWMPVIVTLFLVPAYFIVSKVIPMLNNLTVFVAIMAEIPAAWMVLIKLVSLFTSGISIYDDKIRLRYSRFAAFHTIIADRKKLVKVTIEQTFFQQFNKRRNIIFWFEGEGNRRHKIRAMSEKDTAEILQLLGYEDDICRRS